MEIEIKENLLFNQLQKKKEAVQCPGRKPMRDGFSMKHLSIL